MKSFLLTVLLYLNFIIYGYCYVIPYSDSKNRIKSFNFGIPSNLTEALEWKFGKKEPIAKVHYLKHSTKKYFREGPVKPFNFITTYENENDREIFTSLISQAENYISNALEIYQTINVRFNVLDFCNDESYKNRCRTILGATYPPIQIPLKMNNDENSPIYSFPQALVKQLKLNEDIEFTDIDIVIYLNSYIRNSKNAVTIITHEIFHGLGIYTNAILSNTSIFNFGSYDEFLMPRTFYDLDMNNYKNQNKISLERVGFLPFSIYEKNLVLKSNPGRFYIENIKYYFKKEFDVRKQTFSNEVNNFFISYFKTNEFKEAVELVKMYKKENSIDYKTKNKQINIQTFDNEYKSGSSICHIAYQYPMSRNYYNRNNDFLMYYSVSLQDNVDTLINMFNNKYKLISDNLVDIMTTMGWTEKGKNRNESIYYVTNYEVSNEELEIMIDELDKQENEVTKMTYILTH